MPVVSLLIAATVTATTVPVPVPMPPPPVIVSPVVNPYTGNSGAPATTQTIDITVRQDGHMLWSGEVTRASTGMASFSQQLRESRACPAEPPTPFQRNGNRNTSLSVSITPGYPQTESDVQVSVERTRPYDKDGEDCPGGIANGNSSTVRFETRATLPVGKPVTIDGEGGLSITLVRR